MLVRLMADPDMKRTLRAEANRNVRTALQILDREYMERANALTSQVKLAEWHAISIEKDIGYNPDSITKYNQYLTGKNQELPAANRFDADAIVEKILGAIRYPATLAATAERLLESPNAL